MNSRQVTKERQASAGYIAGKRTKQNKQILRKGVKKMDVYDMLSAIIKKYGFESKEAIGFASDVESGSSLDWLQFLYYETMEKGEDLY